MGLDNGITIKGDLPKSGNEIPRCMDWHEYKIEIAYWRKCWGLRNYIIHNVVNYQVDKGVEYEYTLNVHDLKDIKEYLIKLLDKDFYIENEDSIWSWEDSLMTNATAIANISWVIEWMQDHEVTVEFYDSY